MFVKGRYKIIKYEEMSHPSLLQYGFPPACTHADCKRTKQLGSCPDFNLNTNRKWHGNLAVSWNLYNNEIHKLAF